MGVYNPNAIRRTVRKQAETPDGQVLCVSKSWTRQDVEHHPVVDTATGEVFCTCEQFRFRLAPAARRANKVPAITAPCYQCKHIERAVAGCVRRHELLEVGKVTREDVAETQEQDFDYSIFDEPILLPTRGIEDDELFWNVIQAKAGTFAA